MSKAMEADPDDEVAVRMFGNANQMADSLTSEGRGFARNKAELTDYENYLCSGMPLTGFSDWYNLKVQVDSMYSASDMDYSEYVSNDMNRLCRPAKSFMMPYMRSRRPPQSSASGRRA